MILNSMLDGSPVFLFAMSLVLLAMYGVARLAKACFQYGQRAFRMRGTGRRTPEAIGIP